MATTNPKPDTTSELTIEQIKAASTTTNATPGREFAAWVRAQMEDGDFEAKVPDDLLQRLVATISTTVRSGGQTTTVPVDASRIRTGLANRVDSVRRQLGADGTRTVHILTDGAEVGAGERATVRGAVVTYTT